MINVRCFVLVLMLLAGQVLFAQSDLMIQGTTPNLYVNHQVQPKENWYSVGRTYNLSPREIANFNKTSIDKPLSVSQVLRIPLISANFSQNNQKASDEVLVPVYHTIQEKEWMYRVSVNHNKVPIENLEKWNNVSRNDAKAGMKLIVGFLKVKSAQSPLAGRSYTPAATTTSTSASPASNSSAPAANPTASTPTPNTAQKEPLFRDNSPIPKETPKREAASASQETRAAANHKGGIFRSQYDDTGKSASGVSGVFRSNSGWTDGKYYALMNNVPVGTIVKVSFPSTAKSVYAKVLGQLPDMKESVGLTIRISEAAASELGAGNSKFSVDVNY